MSEDDAKKIEISALPSPVEILVNQPQAPSRPGYGKQIEYMRDISKWIIGGVVATAAAVATGASLTNIGELDIATSPLRLGLSLLGFAIGVGAIGRIFVFALRIFTTDVATLDDIIDAGQTDPDGTSKFARLAREVKSTFAFEKNKDTWDDLKIDQNTGVCKKPELDRKICEMLGFLNIRMEFLDLQKSLLFWGPAAMAGFILFAWSANPADAPPAPTPAVEEIVEFEYDENGQVVRQTTRHVKIEPSS